MFKVFIFALCFFVATGSQAGSREVEGIINCGSEAAIEDIRITDCRRVPCEAFVGNSYRIDIDFRPSIDHEFLHLNIVLVKGENWEGIIDSPVPDSAVDAGRLYTFGYTFTVTGAFMGEAEIAFNLLGVDETGEPDYPELCFRAGIFVRPQTG